MDNTEIYKLTLNPEGFTIGLEFHTGGKDLRVLSKEEPRQGLYVACARVLALGVAFYELPDGLQFGLKSIAFSNGDEPGSVVQAEGFVKKIRLQLPKISRKEVKRRVGGEEDYEVDPEHPQNKFNLAIKDLRDEILFYIRGQRQQLTLGLFDEYGEAIAEEAAEAVVGRGRAVADKVIDFPKASAAQ